MLFDDKDKNTAKKVFSKQVATEKSKMTPDLTQKSGIYNLNHLLDNDILDNFLEDFIKNFRRFLWRLYSGRTLAK